MLCSVVHEALRQAHMLYRSNRNANFLNCASRLYKGKFAHTRAIVLILLMTGHRPRPTSNSWKRSYDDTQRVT
jgi:hypothetical protein